MRRTEALVKCSQGRRGGLIFGNNFPNFEQGSAFDRILPPLYGEFKLLGEFRGSLVAGASGQRDISSGTSTAAMVSAAEGTSTAARVPATTGASAAMTSTTSLRTSGAASEKEYPRTHS
jgi:hypothetical protein